MGIVVVLGVWIGVGGWSHGWGVLGNRRMEDLCGNALWSNWERGGVSGLLLAWMGQCGGETVVDGRAGEKLRRVQEIQDDRSLLFPHSRMQPLSGTAKTPRPSPDPCPRDAV